MKTKKSVDLVRYENSHEESEFVDYVDYDFAYDMNLNMNSTTNFNNTLTMENFNNTITLRENIVNFDETLNKNQQNCYIKPKISYNKIISSNPGIVEINNGFTSSKILNETRSEFIGELNNDNKFYGMSHFDEASRVGFGVEEETFEESNKIYYKNNYEDFENSQKKNKIENLQNLQNPNNINLTNTHVYDTNLTNINQNFNFNVDSEIEKIDFDKYDVDKMESLLDREIFQSSRNLKQINHEKISNQHLNNFINVKKGKSNDPKNPPEYNNKILQEIKSAVNLIKEPKEMQLKTNTKIVSKSIEDYDKVNLISLENGEMLNLIKNNREKLLTVLNKDNTIIQEEKHNLEKYKVKNNYEVKCSENRNKNISKKLSMESEEFEIELDSRTEQITDFKKSQKKNPNKKSNSGNSTKIGKDYDINSENYMNIEITVNESDNELELLNKLQQLQKENVELKLKLQEKDDIVTEKKEKIVTNDNIQPCNLTPSTTERQNLDLENENRLIREELQEIRQKFDKKCRETLDYKSKFDNLQFEHDIIEKKLLDNKSLIQNLKQEISDKENIINNMKIDLKKKEEQFLSANEENENFKNQTENIKVEFSVHRQEMSKKSEKITELQQKIFNLEQENIEIRSKSSGELMNLRDQKQSFDTLKSNFMDLKNQNELLNIKFQRIADENFNLKRDNTMYEKELKSKTDLIEKYKNELINSENLNKYFNNKIEKENKCSDINVSTISNQYDKYEKIDNLINRNQERSPHRELKRDRDRSINNFNTKSNLAINANNVNLNETISSLNSVGTRNSTQFNNSQISKNNFLNNNYQEKYDPISNMRSSIQSNTRNSTTSVNGSSKINTNSNYPQNETRVSGNVLPSQKVMVMKESRILDVETKLYTIQQERDKVINFLINCLICFRFLRNYLVCLNFPNKKHKF